ncbi:hypothetical protein A4H02_01135 [Fervidobacterium thailandense]|uniref:Uncharacterized protein n=2 Tax=Fervidobacterium thailandense TaxID=1008305 RepID=A0A1E3G5I7_9BACT|nr:hypothetical protein A4H02_01135 [Fervidobacterium thailandense]
MEHLDEELKEVSCPECIRCGWCCKQTVCYYGEWDYQKWQCKFLTDDNLCSKYDEIVRYESQLGLDPGLFGSGCCLNFMNPYRVKIMLESQQGGRCEENEANG